MAMVMWYSVGSLSKQVEQAKAMGWNKALQQPISQDGIDLKADIELLNFDWCQEVEKPILKAAVTMDLDNLSLPFFSNACKALQTSSTSKP